MKKVIVLMLVAFFATQVVVPVAIAQENVVVTVETIDVPGGCSVEVEGAEGSFKGFVGFMLGDELQPGVLYDFFFQDATSFYTVDWGLIEYEGITVFIFCRKSHIDTIQDDLIIYVHGGEITNVDFWLDGEKKPMEPVRIPKGPNASVPNEFRHIEQMMGWEEVGSFIFLPKKMTLTISK